MFFLFRKRLLLDTSAAELMRVKQILDKHGIAYEVKTTMSDNVLSRNFNARAAQFRHEAYSKTANQSYVYYLYVHRKDYARAKNLV